MPPKLPPSNPVPEPDPKPGSDPAKKAQVQWIEIITDAARKELSQEIVATEQELLDLNEREMKALERQNYQQDIGFRKVFAIAVCALVLIWLVFVATIVTLTASGYLHLADQTLITLIVSTSATVFGLFHTIIKYFFSRNPK